MVVLNFDEGPSIKVPLMVRFYITTNIGCLTLSLKEETIVGLHCLLVLDKEGIMKVNS